MRPLLLALALLPPACGESPGAHAEHAPGHVHDAVYGGNLVEVGEHFAQLELVHDAAKGELVAYVWDGHVQDAVPLAMPAIRVRGEADGKAFRLELRPAASALSGDAAGHASRFAGAAQALVGARRVEGRVEKLEIQERTFEGVGFQLGD